MSTDAGTIRAEKGAPEAGSVPRPLEDALDRLANAYPERRSATLMFLHALQRHFGYLPPAAIEWTASKLGLEPINVYELVTFYPMFHPAPVGKYHLKICRTLSCALNGSDQLREYLCGKLGLDSRQAGAQTTPDGKFTVEFVECLASCGTAPVMLCNEDFHESVSREKADEILAACNAGR